MIWIKVFFVFVFLGTLSWILLLNHDESRMAEIAAQESKEKKQMSVEDQIKEIRQLKKDRGVLTAKINELESALPKEKKDKTFVVIYSPGEKWIKDKAVFEQPLMEHGKYMSKKMEEGVLVGGGPFLDNSGGLCIFTAKTEEDAKAFVENDPAIKEKVMNGKLTPWYRVFHGE